MKRRIIRSLALLLVFAMVLSTAPVRSYAATPHFPTGPESQGGGGQPAGSGSESESGPADPEPTATPAPDTTEPTPTPVPAATPTPTAAPEPTATPEPTPTPTAPGTADTETTNPGTSGNKPENAAQNIVKDGVYGDWIDRVDLPEYAYGLYDALEDGSDEEGLGRYLIEDDYFAVDPGADESYDGEPAQVLEAATVTTEEIPLLAGSGGGFIFDTGYFADKYDKVDVDKGDTRISYASLKEGDVVMTSSFNGIFVTKIPYVEKTFEADYTKVCAYITTSYHAFDRDHPEVFWLSGKSVTKILTATVDYNGATKKEAYFFFVLASSDGFTLRSDEYAAPGSVDAGIARREEAVKTILSAVDAKGSRRDQIRTLNKWLTEHNAYNSSPDLDAIGNDPHECLVALVGTTGRTGPVCDGYSRAFKVLCDRLGIPCVLADGYAKTSASAAGEAHMWNNVKMTDGNWYGVDVTWNDPTVAARPDAALSGRENENYLLVGKDTVIKGLAFGVSHPEYDRVSDGGVSFAAGLALSSAAYDPEASAKVVLSPQKLTVDGKAVDCEKYNIDGRNYFMLRDLALLLDGTGSRFGVEYDTAAATVIITTGKAYSPNGTELKAGADNSSSAKPSSQTIRIDGAKRGDLTVYNIGGSNFFQLRELGDALNFDVDFDSASNTAIVRSVKK